MRDDDEQLQRIAETLKQPVRVSSALDARVMRAVRRMPPHSPAGLWSRLTTPRRVSVTPLRWALLAAAVVASVGLAARGISSGVAGSAAPPSANATTRPVSRQPVQFVLVAPDAKKVAVVGDFNGWDVSHKNYQAQHRGGGVWAVTAALPVGHHRYSFVVDDSVWVADPIAPRAVDNDFGVTSSTIVVSSQE